jgi:DNA gyrase subunit A
MVVADPDATLLTACVNGYGKRTPFGPNASPEDSAEGEPASASGSAAGPETDDETSSSFRYRTQNRGGKGLRDIKTTERNGPVIGIVRVDDTDELMMMTSRGKIQRVAVSDFNPIGRNTQGVRIMSLDEGDTLAAIVRVPKEEDGGGEEEVTAVDELPS